MIENSNNHAVSNNANDNPNSNRNGKVVANITEIVRNGKGLDESNDPTKPKIDQVDSRDLNEQYLTNLKILDPFMYYSVPGVRKADILVRDIDYSDVDSLIQGFSARRGRRQGYRQDRDHAGMVNDDNMIGGENVGTILHRKSRHSTECHMSIVMQELFLE